MERSLSVARAGGCDDGIDEWEVGVVEECRRAPSRARRSSLENDRFVARGCLASRAVGRTRLPSFVRPRLLAIPFGDDGMALMTVVSCRSIVAASAVGLERRRWGGRSMGLKGSDCAKGVDSGRWAAEGEGVGSGRGGRGWNNYGCLVLLSLPLASVEAPRQESYGGKKKFFPGESGKYPGRGGKKLKKKTWTIDGGTVVPIVDYYLLRYSLKQPGQTGRAIFSYEK